MQAFNSLTKAVLAILGKDGFLRGNVPCRVNIEHGVQVAGYEEDATYARSVATIVSTLNPRKGDALKHPDGEFVLDGLVADNGYTQRWTVVKR